MSWLNWFNLGKKKMVLDRGRFKEAKNVGSVSENKTLVGKIKAHGQQIADIDAELAKQK
jgi:hypothetical protein